jgi:hypothetical protein
MPRIQIPLTAQEEPKPVCLVIGRRSKECGLEVTVANAREVREIHQGNRGSRQCTFRGGYRLLALDESGDLTAQLFQLRFRYMRFGSTRSTLEHRLHVPRRGGGRALRCASTARTSVRFAQRDGGDGDYRSLTLWPSHSHRIAWVRTASRGGL